MTNQAARKTGGMRRQISRRSFLVAAAPVIAAPAILRHSRAFAQEPVVKIGFVGPSSGVLGPFGGANSYVIENVREIFNRGVENNGREVKIEVVALGTDSANTGDLASQLIYGEKVDLILAAGAPNTVVQTADLAEVVGVPCVSTVSPWEAFFFGRGGDPEFGFEWTYHFFWGLGDLIAAYVAMWKNSGVEPIVGGVFPAQPEGAALSDPETGIPGKLKSEGFTYVDPGQYLEQRIFSGGRHSSSTAAEGDFSPQIEALKAGGCEIVTGFMLPPIFKSFWQQAFEQGFRPKIATFMAATVFPEDVEAIGDRAIGLSAQAWWSPQFPFKSSLTGQSAADLARAYSEASGRPWPQSIGPNHALFEVAADVIKRAADIDDKAAIIDAVASTDLQTIAGPISWTGTPVKNVTTTPVVGGQWLKGPAGFELVVVDNTTHPEIPTNGELQLME